MATKRNKWNEAPREKYLHWDSNRPLLVSEAHSDHQPWVGTMKVEVATFLFNSREFGDVIFCTHSVRGLSYKLKEDRVLSLIFKCSCK